MIRPVFARSMPRHSVSQSVSHVAINTTHFYVVFVARSPIPIHAMLTLLAPVQSLHLFAAITITSRKTSMTFVSIRFGTRVRDMDIVWRGAAPHIKGFDPWYLRNLLLLVGGVALVPYGFTEYCRNFCSLPTTSLGAYTRWAPPHHATLSLGTIEQQVTTSYNTKTAPAAKNNIIERKQIGQIRIINTSHMQHHLNF